MRRWRIFRVATTTTTHIVPNVCRARINKKNTFSIDLQSLKYFPSSTLCRDLSGSIARHTVTAQTSQRYERAQSRRNLVECRPTVRVILQTRTHIRQTGATTDYTDLPAAQNDVNEISAEYALHAFVHLQSQ
jgi:hypothetical protein